MNIHTCWMTGRAAKGAAGVSFLQGGGLQQVMMIVMRTMGFMAVMILLFVITIFHRDTISSNRAALEVMVVTIKIEWH